MNKLIRPCAILADIFVNVNTWSKSLDLYAQLRIYQINAVSLPEIVYKFKIFKLL